MKKTKLGISAALVVAALGAEGVSRVEGIHHIDRGYELLEHKFKLIGADVERYEDDDNSLVIQNKGIKMETSIYDYEANINITTTPNGDKVLTMNDAIFTKIIKRQYKNYTLCTKPHHLISKNFTKEA